MSHSIDPVDDDDVPPEMPGDAEFLAGFELPPMDDSPDFAALLGGDTGLPTELPPELIPDILPTEAIVPVSPVLAETVPPVEGQTKVPTAVAIEEAPVESTEQPSPSPPVIEITQPAVPIIETKDGLAPIVTYQTTVRNRGASVINGLRIEHQPFPKADVLETVPTAIREGDRLVWPIGDLAIGAEAVLAVKLCLPIGHEIPTEIEFESSYVVRKPLRASLQTGRLVPTIEADDVIGFQSIGEVRFYIANHTSEVARNVRLRAYLPAELQPSEARQLEESLGDILPDTARIVRLPIFGRELGTHRVEVGVLAEEGTPQTTARSIHVLLPRVEIRTEASVTVELGEIGTAEILCHNSGPGFARIVFSLDQPSGVELASDSALQMTVPPLCRERLPLAVRGTIPGTYEIRVNAELPDRSVYQSIISVRVTMPPRAVPLRELIETTEIAPSVSAESGSESMIASEELYIVFGLGSADYAIPLDRVREVDRPLPITPLPFVPHWVLGVAGLRGEILSMIHLSAFLGLGDHTIATDARMLIVKAEAGDDLTIGLLVDRIIGMRRLHGESLRMPKFSRENRLSGFVDKVVEDADRMLIVLAIDRIVHAPEMRDLGRAD